MIPILILFFFAPEANAEVAKISLDKFAGIGIIDLKCIGGEYKISIPIPERWSIKSASISISYANSINLIAEKSQMAVKLNNRPLGQARLSPIDPEGKIELPVSPYILVSGYNNLSFHVAQHYSESCEQQCDPNLWTTVKFDDSFLEVEYTLKPVPLKLSEVSNFLFDPKIFPDGDVHIITENTSSEIITAAGIVASGVAKRFDYRKVFFSASGDIKPGYDNIIVGKKEFVETFLKQKNIDMLHSMSKCNTMR